MTYFHQRQQKLYDCQKRFGLVNQVKGGQITS